MIDRLFSSRVKTIGFLQTQWLLLNKYCVLTSSFQFQYSMFSNPSFQPNPNPKFPKPSSIPIEYKYNNNMKSHKIPNWLELPEEIWFTILAKLTTIDIIENTQKVCMLFRKLCKQPAMFQTIDLTLPNGYTDEDLPYDINVMTQFAVDRSCGCLVDIYLEIVCDDDTLMYIVERSNNLKHLRLGHHIGVSDKGLVEAVKLLPMLEELELIMCSFYDSTVEVVGRFRPSLKALSLNNVWSKDWKCNDEAMAIARSMHNLRSLQLIGNCMTNEGLEAILDGCPLLESFDLRACVHINLSGDLGKRCKQLKHFLHPNASTADYGHQA